MRIRHSALAAAITGAFLCLPIAADAASKAPAWQTYGGVGYQSISLGHGSAGAGFPGNLSDGINFHLGERFGRFMAVEVGYSRSNAENDVSTAPAYQTKMAVAGPTLDLLGYLPLGSDQFSLIGTGGISYFTGKGTTGNPVAPFAVRSNTELGGRIGAGAEWRPVKGFSLDLLGRYQSADFNGLSKGGLMMSLGVNFYF